MMTVRVARVSGLLVGLILLAAERDAAAGMPAVCQEEKKASFEIYADSTKEFRWRLKDSGGKTLATGGEGYKDKADCRKAVDKIKSEAKTDKVTFEVYEDNAKEHRWRLKSKNGQIIASSSGSYKTKADCDAAVETVKKVAGDAEVKEVK